MKEIRILSKFCSFLITQSDLYRERKRIQFLSRYKIDGSSITKNVEIFNIQNVSIGIGTYMNSGQIHAGPNSKIIIGNYCAIGYNVHIKSYTHDIEQPTGLNIKMSDRDIEFGNNVWVGDNVYIKEGITIGNNVIIGANSVVTRSFPDSVIIGGCPAKELNKLK
jgi:maltose O-acetyltransferase